MAVVDYLMLLERVATSAEDVVEERTWSDGGRVMGWCVPQKEIGDLMTAVDELKRFRAAGRAGEAPRSYVVINGAVYEVHEIDRKIRWGAIGLCALMLSLILVALAVLR